MVNTFDYIIDKYKINVGNQYIIDIPNMGRDDMAKLFGELQLNYGVEVGVELGLYSEVLLKANPNLDLYCVDPWLADAYDPDVHAVNKDQESFDARFKECEERLGKYPNATMIRATSAEALDAFKDNSLDFVYIDANHDFPNFIFDIHNWMKKVRPGGIISGHDYAPFSYKKHNHVKRALDAYARCYRMIPFFVIGSYEVIPGETRDKYRSWMYVKPL